VHYEHVDIGYNYRMSNLLAALGRAQLSRLDSMIAKRREMREAYKRVFAEVDGVDVFGANGDEEDNVWLTSIVIDSEVTGWQPKDLAAALAADDIESRPLWKPMHKQPVFERRRGVITGASEKLFESGLTLPSGSATTAAQRARIEAAVQGFLEKR
jgi:dTDP-4-amino-4,6-dideoxygalactose transaminase